MFSRIGTTELLIILGIALLIFGPASLPKLGKSFGETIASFKRGHAEASKTGEEVQVSDVENKKE